MSCIFTCYNPVQKEYFYQCGFHELIYGIHPKSKKKFWVFERTDKFNKAYEDWLVRNN